MYVTSCLYAFFIGKLAYASLIDAAIINPIITYVYSENGYALKRLWYSHRNRFL